MMKRIEKRMMIERIDTVIVLVDESSLVHDDSSRLMLVPLRELSVRLVETVLVSLD